MAVTAANQTFRKAVLPVLSELDIHLNLPDQELDNEQGISAYVPLNFNNPTFIVDAESTLLEDVPSGATVQIAFGSTLGKDTAWPNSPLDPQPQNNALSAISFTNTSKGRKIKAGLGTGLFLPANISSPSAGGSIIRFNYLLVANLISAGRQTTFSGSTFNKFKFISANPANPQTLVYDIVA